MSDLVLGLSSEHNICRHINHPQPDSTEETMPPPTAQDILNEIEPLGNEYHRAAQECRESEVFSCTTRKQGRTYESHSEDKPLKRFTLSVDDAKKER